jgi:hypothetical protein
VAVAAVAAQIVAVMVWVAAVVSVCLVKALTAQAGQAARQDPAVKAVQAAVVVVMVLMDYGLAHTLAAKAEHLAEQAVKVDSASLDAVVQFLTDRAEWAVLALCALFGPDARVHSHQLV